MPYFFKADLAWDSILGRLQQNSWCGQVIGPHGTGKTTFLFNLAARLTTEFGRVRMIQYQNRKSRLPKNCLEQQNVGIRPPAPSISLIDGFECLGIWQRARLIRHAKKNGEGLVVSSHRNVGLPTILRTELDKEQLDQITRQLLVSVPEDRRAQIEKSIDTQELLHQHRGNAREYLFTLYDRYEELS